MGNHPADLNRVFLALSDPTRRSVVARLGRGPATVSDLAQPFAMALPSFMKHIRLLEEAGLIRTQKHGRTRQCEVDQASFRLVDDWLDQQRLLWEGRTDRLEWFVTQQLSEPEP